MAQAPGGQGHAEHDAVTQITAQVPASPAPASAASAQYGEGPGTVIGPYKILELLGEGGFGAVYAAEQREPVRRRVALKIVKLGMDSKEVIARFEAERQALAMMDHPNVAKVFDAGLTDRGRPYFAMEMVPGVAISNYCDENNLATKDRLELFIHVCHAVQHAHQKGIIHRDLKPGNILVTLVDGQPVPKVIDFGIAKATNHQLSAQTIYTETGRLMGTPEYMAPEQAGTSGLDVDTRADVYSLGVILYELLTGALPIDAAKLRAGGYDSIGKVLRETEPAKPSTRLSVSRTVRKDPTPTELRADTKATMLDIAKHRHTDPSSLRSQLRGDLDWITLKALEKDRTRRYETCNALAMDIHRHLTDEPVLARPPSAKYKAGKFVRKHKVGVAAATMVAIALVAGIVGTTLGMVRAVRAEHTAQSNEEKAKSVSKFLTDMISSADINAGKGLKTTLGEVLEGAVQSLDAKTAPDHPEVDAAVRMAIGNTYLSAREGERARPFITEALKLRRQSMQGDSADLAESMNDLALALTQKGLREQKPELYEEADKLYAEALAMKQRVHGKTSKEVAETLNNIGGLRQSQKKLPDAEDTFRQALEMRRTVLGKDHKDVAQSLSNLAFAIKEQATSPPQDETRLDEAQRLYRDSLEMRERLLGPSHNQVATSLNNLAALLRDRGKPKDAEPFQRRAVAIRNSKLPAGWYDALVAQVSLANILTEVDKADEAADLLRAVIEGIAALEKLAKEGKETAPPPTFAIWVKSALGAALVAKKQFDEAEPLLLQSFEAVRDDPNIRWNSKKFMIERIVKLYTAWGKDDKAKEWKAKLEVPSG